jgi:hypothetical protein
LYTARKLLCTPTCKEEVETTIGAVAVTVEIAVGPSKNVTVPLGVNPAPPVMTASNCTLAP